ncbi:MAG: hypothetical protein A2231_11635 [Candidatus Firestonebacteria bacterium RIFOXYA2_FULL_40_8]|nr:MAG: hypothetical protein A2231_11635 [Candidatus Firestonebacteria bacterium RIFOXYA2_FULL_40_8]
MKRVIYTAIAFCLVFSIGVFAQIKKFDLKGSGSTKTTASTASKKSTVTSSTKATLSVPAVKSALSGVKLPALPAGFKRVDINVLQQEYFECPKCKKEFSKAGKCPVHKVDLISNTRSYTFKCKLCGFTSEKEGKCPTCKGNPVMRKFEVTYQDVGCKEVSSEPGKCPKCKQDLKKIITVELKK